MSSECKVSESTSQQCQAAITDRLASLLGEEGVEILTEYIWHMITRPKTTKEHVCSELKEFLGNDTDAFVNWLIQVVGPAVSGDLHQGSQIVQEAQPTQDTMSDQRQSVSHYESRPQALESMDEAADMVAPLRMPMPQTQPSLVSRRVKYERSDDRGKSSVPLPPAGAPPPPPSQGAYAQQTMGDGGAPVGPMVAMPAAQVFVDPETGVPMQLVPVTALQSQKLGALAGKKIKKRCARYPNCPFGDECRYIHPAEMCMNWPRCTFGPECFYIHPEVPCKYGVNCVNWACNYSHPKERNLEAMQSRYNIYTGTFRNHTLKVAEEHGDPSSVDQ
eukprot:Blabericola_migrator_1__4831@NODE_2536_length_2635_cov_216_016355_g1587_i0_p2_GENE_NODE_2536_length_2635_cov_216_016355_g1587_i0NODE_2536_length_2635_cov_216_016355_g1587_i0_p2_ORF_typecomplete_len332_score47_72zfCCCH_2/PF14608_6/0_00074zfCCCH_2/PF14608_6/0_00095zfCCCH_2/PF14608_6/0_061zfCCCH_4/PF18044_1/0_00011zfCCCH_4/PF18044_1/0_023zfCCCH_4/PF18044_1/50zfCCCH_4/PF18044_1/2_5e02PWI/PF01480_17/2_4e07zfCCCH/PF00642_24/0_00045zfCCCH/PF00642_24/0_12zfCCCH/PF00642_24/1_6e02zfCCCH/PF00642_24/1_6e02N